MGSFWSKNDWFPVLITDALTSRVDVNLINERTGESRLYKDCRQELETLRGPHSLFHKEFEVLRKSNACRY